MDIIRQTLTKELTPSSFHDDVNKTELPADLVDLIIKWPNTCLLVACWLANENLVTILLKRGAAVNFCDSAGRYLFCNSIFANDILTHRNNY